MLPNYAQERQNYRAYSKTYKPWHDRCWSLFVGPRTKALRYTLAFVAAIVVFIFSGGLSWLPSSSKLVDPASKHLVPSELELLNRTLTAQNLRGSRMLERKLQSAESLSFEYKKEIDRLEQENEGYDDLVLSLRNQLNGRKNTIEIQKKDIGGLQRTIESQKRNIEALQTELKVLYESKPNEVIATQPPTQRNIITQRPSLPLDADPNVAAAAGNDNQGVYDAGGADAAQQYAQQDDVVPVQQYARQNDQGAVVNDEIVGDVQDTNDGFQAMGVADDQPAQGDGNFAPLWEAFAGPDDSGEQVAITNLNPALQYTFRSASHTTGALHLVFGTACPAEAEFCNENLGDGLVTYDFSEKPGLFALCYCKSPTELGYAFEGILQVVVV